ncbi:MAG: hypothetical protein LBB79_07635, partial [Prevotellaceae bacterium]|nr:hypothetical protein [Prevotellaceae bacterium]
MKSMLKFFLIMLLPAVAAWATSCQDDDSWKPTWALPLVKAQTITIGYFMGDDAVKEVNDRVKEKWEEYVEKKFAEIDSANVDSIAYAVLAEDTTSTYVTFNNGIPELNDSTKKLIRENLKENGQSEAKIAQINSFLAAYSKATQSNNPPQPSTQSSKAKARPRDSDGNSDGGSSDYYGGGSAIHNLLDAMIHPTDVFITAANLLSTMGKDYLGSINDQID